MFPKTAWMPVAGRHQRERQRDHRVWPVRCVCVRARARVLGVCLVCAWCVSACVYRRAVPPTTVLLPLLRMVRSARSPPPSAWVAARSSWSVSYGM